MPQTYTVTPWNNTETPGDQYTGSPGNTPGAIQQPFLVIQPANLGNEAQFVVARENFGITSGTPVTFGWSGEALFYNGQNGVVMPEEVEYVTMMDTGTPNTPGNTILVTVFLNPTFEMPSNDYTIDIDITGAGTVWDPTSSNNDGSNYVFGIYLTNGMWPGGNSYYAPPNIAVPNDGTIVPYYDENGVFQFGIANYTEATAESWNEYEAQGKQNPYAIPNCIIQQINSPVSAAVGDELDENGNGYSWVTQSTEGTNINDSVGTGATIPIPCYFGWEIRPISSNYKVSIEDFSIMTRDVKQMVASYVYDPYYNPNEPSTLLQPSLDPWFPGGFAYYKEWENNNPYLNLNNCPENDPTCTSWPSVWEWSFPSDIEVSEGFASVAPLNSINDSSGLGEAQLTPPDNYNALYTEDVMIDLYNTDTDTSSTYDWWPGISDYIGITNAATVGNYWGNDETFGNCDGLGSWSSFFSDIQYGIGISNGGFQKYFSKVMVFMEDNPGGINEIDPIANMNNDNNMGEGNVNAFGPPPINKLQYGVNASDEATMIYNGGSGGSLIDTHPGCYSPNSFIRMVTMQETNPGANDNKIIVTAFPCQNSPSSSNDFMDMVAPFMRRFFLQINGKATIAGQGLPPISYDIDLIDTNNSGTISFTEEPE